MRKTFKVRFGEITRRIITDAAVRQAMKTENTYKVFGPSLTLRALWDTGASSSVISAGVAKRLGFISVDTKGMTGIGGTILSERYYLSITLPNGVTLPVVKVAEWGGSLGFDLLIGMDIISRGNFSIVNDWGRTVFTFKV
jgi:hypothetical protein